MKLSTSVIIIGMTLFSLGSWAGELPEKLICMKVDCKEFGIGIEQGACGNIIETFGFSLMDSNRVTLSSVSGINFGEGTFTTNETSVVLQLGEDQYGQTIAFNKNELVQQKKGEQCLSFGTYKNNANTIEAVYQCNVPRKF